MKNILKNCILLFVLFLNINLFGIEIHEAAKSNNVTQLNILLDLKETPDQDGNRPLHLAAQSQSVDAIKLLITNNVMINSVNKYGLTALHLAAINSGDEETITLLLENGAKINMQDSINLASAMHLTIACNKLLAFRALLNYQKTTSSSSSISNSSLNVNIQDNNGQSPLHLAVKYLNTAIIIDLLNDQRVNINLQDYNGKTPLMLAIEAKTLGVNCEQIIKKLIDKDSDVYNLKDLNGKTAFDLVCEQNPLSMQNINRIIFDKFNLDNNITLSPNIFSPIDFYQLGNSSLPYNNQTNNNETNSDIINTLEQNLSPLNLETNLSEPNPETYLVNLPEESNTDKPLISFSEAAKKDDTQIMEYYLKLQDFDINKLDENKWSALHYAVFFKSKNAVAFLKLKDADFNVKGKHSIRPLHLAAKNDDVDMLKFLMWAGANGNVNDDFGDTPLHWAISAKSQNAIDFFISKKDIDLNSPGSGGQTPLFFAVQEINIDAVEAISKSPYVVKDVKDSTGSTPYDLAKKWISDLQSNNLSDSQLQNLEKIIELLEPKIEVEEFKPSLFKNVPSSNTNIITPEKLSRSSSFNNDQTNIATKLVCKSEEFIEENSLNSYVIEEILPEIKTQDEIAKEQVILTQLALKREKKKQNKKEKNEKGNSELHIGIANFKDINQLITPETINKPNKEGNTPLHCAVINNNCEAANLLLFNGAIIDPINTKGHTPLYYAINNNIKTTKYAAILNLLLENGADCKLLSDDLKTIIKELNLFHTCIDKCQNEVLEIELYNILITCIKMGAYINELNNLRETPLHRILKLKNCSFRIVKLLLDNDAPVTLKDKFGAIPLHYAVSLDNSNLNENSLKERIEIIKLLISKDKSTVSAVNLYGETPIFYAKNVNIIKILIALGANAFVKNADGINTFILSFIQRSSDAVDFYYNYTIFTFKKTIKDIVNDIEYAIEKDTTNKYPDLQSMRAKFIKLDTIANP